MRVTVGSIALLGICVGGLVIACFSEHSPAGPDNSNLCSNPSGSVVNGSTLVTIRDFSFETGNVTVQAGSSVTWVNCETSGAPAHTSTSDQGTWSSPLLTTGDTYSVTFAAPGAFPYHCDPHPFMTGTVTVE